MSSTQDQSNQTPVDENKIACLDMCYYCFEMLGFYFNLNKKPTPKFKNEAW